MIIILWTTTSFAPYSEPLWFLLIGRSFLNPIAEEILFRGFLFGYSLYVISLIFRSWWKVVPGIGILFLQAWYFAFVHGSPGVPMKIRFTGAIVYGIWYWIGKKNLLPPTIAHITHHILISVDYFNIPS